MTGDRETPSSGPPSLAGAPWLRAPATQAVLAALAAAGFDGRIVGGTVRNALMGLPVSDIDIATPAKPHDVVASCTAAGLTAVPTGLEHGTVTIVAHHVPVEVTTLRRDVETDGRRAVVAFGADWSEDAHRRDFTMNALYCDADGRIHDYVGGYDDLVARRVRFIGDADRRIAEDYLRILRFFRFYAAYGSGEPDPIAIEACGRGVGGMARLSSERIRAELVKLLVAPGVVASVEAMQGVGLLPVVLGAAPRPGVLTGIVQAEAALEETADAMLRLSALAIAVPDDIGRVAARLRLSTEERKSLLVIDSAQARKSGSIDAKSARRLVYRRGRATCRRLAVALAALDPDRRGEAHLLKATAASWSPPRMPLSGADLMARGIEAGPLLGRKLGEIEDWWVEQDFPTRSAVLAHLDVLIGASPDGADAED